MLNCKSGSVTWSWTLPGIPSITFFFFFFWLRLGLRCCSRAFSGCGEQGLLFVAVRGLLIVVASLVLEHEL